MVASQRALFLSLALSLSGTFAQAQNAAPVLDDPVQANRVAPTIPGGRALLFPITASDADGDRLTYTVKSSNPRILARVKTGNPFLKFTINHAAGGAGDPAFSGDVYFMLLRDWTPITSGFIGGFAQSGFYDATIFHRISDLSGPGQGFILQGGDPLGTGLGGPGMGTPPVAANSWKFDNERDPSLIFVGRGQLAMANAGTSTQIFNGQAFGDFKDSNGSQFFITNDSTIRFLDFRHTVFAQLVRGWELLPAVLGAERQFAAVNDPNEPRPSKPVVPITITGASVVPQTGATQSDAVLVLSAIGAGASTITVTVDDRRGGTATKTFTVTGVKETSNTPPFLQEIAPLATPKDTSSIFAVEAVDLEHDFTSINHFRITVDGVNTATRSSFLLSNGTPVTTGPTAALRPNAGYLGPLHMGFIADQFLTGDQAFTQARLATNAVIGVGERIAIGARGIVEGAPGVPFSGVAGKIRDFDPASLPGDFTAQINWGDGSPIDPGTVGIDPASPGASLLTASGTHTYARAGIYPVVVTFTGNRGVVGLARGQAIIAATAIRAVGEQLEVTGAAVKNRLLATFSDSASTGTPGDYSALVDWGDGAITDGSVATGVGGRFIVRGTHTFRDAERYAIHVRIRRKLDPPGLNEAWAWTSVALTFKATPHLPPFPKPNLTAAWQSDLSKGFTGVPGPNYSVQVAGPAIFINSGNRTMPSCVIRYWLSDDGVLSKATDKPVRVRLQGSAAFGPQLTLTNFRAGVSTGNVGVTLALPKGQSGGRKFIVTELSYHDPLTDVEAIDKEFASPQIDPAIVLVATSNLRTTESGGTATFTAVLDTQPTADVTIPLVSSNPGEGTVSPSQLVFTTANWNVPQTVTATGVEDAPAVKEAPKNYVIQLNAVTSTDALYSGLNPTDVTLTNLDNEP